MTEKLGDRSYSHSATWKKSVIVSQKKKRSFDAIFLVFQLADIYGRLT